MKTRLITQLASFSDTYTENATNANKIMGEAERCSYIKLLSPCYSLDIDLELYPELKPLIKKMCKYIVNCESKKQKEIMLEILHAMEEQ